MLANDEIMNHSLNLAIAFNYQRSSFDLINEQSANNQSILFVLNSSSYNYYNSAVNEHLASANMYYEKYLLTRESLVGKDARFWSKLLGILSILFAASSGLLAYLSVNSEKNSHNNSRKNN
jgi:hypothetical protein